MLLKIIVSLYLVSHIKTGYVLLFFTVLPLVAHSEAPAPHIVINEVMSSNGETIADEDGDYEDWIELYNAGNETVSLHYWGITDDESRPYRWVFPDVELEPGEFLLVWASGKDRTNTEAPLHTSFRISREGEPLVLRDLQGVIIDSLPPLEIPRDWSYGRSPDGSGHFLFFDTPTPGAPNASEGLEELLKPPVFSVPSGFYPHPFELDITPADSADGTTILYTLDGSLPDPANLDTAWYAIRNAPDRDKEYRPVATYTWEQPITIADRSDEPNDLSLITGTYGRHRDPATRLDKGTTVRAAVYKEGRMGPVATRTFFVGSRFDTYHALPVLSLVAPEKELFGYQRGILVPGAEFDYESEDTRGGNYMYRGREWEREARAQYFLPDGQLVIDQDIGLRIHGGTSRHYTHKSLRLYARADYGKRFLEYPFFREREEQRFKRLKLRNSGQDIAHTFFRDGLISRLMLNTHVDVEAFQPVQVFINGEFWGIMNMRERFDRYYVQERYGVNEQDVDILDHWLETDEHYSEFRDFVTNANPYSEQFFETISSYIDVLSLFDMRIADIYFGRWDIHHWRLWREGSRPDSRWRWNLWDMDVGLGLPNDWGPSWTHGAPVDADYLEPFLTGFKKESFNFEFQRILKNPQARALFINRFADLMNTRFTAEKVLEMMDGMQSDIQPVIGKHIDRWRPPGGIGSKKEWLENIGVMKKFASQRREHVLDHLQDYFDLETAHITVERGGGCGNIMVNTIKPDDSDNDPWEGIYFNGNKIRLEAEGVERCTFLGWEIDGQWEHAGETLVVDPEPGMYIKARFQREVTVEPATPILTGLLSNYPNPFNRQTVIPFILSSADQVHIRVYDALGRRVGTVVSDNFKAGRHRLDWDAGSLASGVYVVIMKTGGKRNIQKITILK